MRPVTDETPLMRTHSRMLAERPMKILFAVHDWGLGHATRDLVLIRALVAAGHAVTVISNGRALWLLRAELGEACRFESLQDIPKPLGRHAATFYIKMSLALPAVLWTFQREHGFAERLHRAERFDCVISDSRFGVYLRGVPSYYLFHSLRQIIPGRPRSLERLVEASQKRLLRKADKILIPDQRENGLAGDLCHRMDCDWGDRIEYLGIVSGIRRQAVDQDVDYFISVSGAEPQRSIFESIVLRQARSLPGRVVIALGRPEGERTVEDDGRVAIHSFMDRRQQEEMLNRARLVVSRPGYTTLMELAELGRRALVVPTVGQSEQEYLAEYHRGKRHIHAVRQSELVLSRDVAIAETRPGLPRAYGTRESVRRFLGVVCGSAGELAT
jgi:glycosyltransferase involved in cell wall biosynthesis